MKYENLVICDSLSQKREFIDDDVIMFVYLVWSHYDHDQAGCVAPGKLATATATAARSPHNICRSSAVPGPALPGESENTRETDSWDTENWVRGEKLSPDTFNIVCTLSIQDLLSMLLLSKLDPVLQL